MAQLPVYRQQGNITIDTPAQVRDLSVYSQGARNMQGLGNALYELSAKWQESKDAVENLNGRNKLSAGLTEILNEAQNYNEYSTPEELQQKEQELTTRMNNLVPDIVSGFSNNQRAREFESNGQFMTQQNTFKLQNIFREKYGDMYNATLQDIADRSLKSFSMTGNEGYKQEYFNALETGVQAGYIDRSQAEKLKLGTDEWNYNYVYSQILENPYFQASDEVLSKITPVQQRTLRNFQRVEQKRAQAVAAQDALNTFGMNPTSDNLQKYYKLNPKAKGNKSLENILNVPMKFDTETTYSGMRGALNAVKNLAVMDVSTPEGKYEYMNAAAEAGWAIKNTKELSNKAKDKLNKIIYNDMINDNFREQLKNMPDLSKEWGMEFVDDYQKLHGDYLRTEMEMRKYSSDKNSEEYKNAEAEYKRALNAKNYYSGFNNASNEFRKSEAKGGVGQRIKDLQRECAKEMLNAYAEGNANKAEQIKQQYGKDMVRLKYWNIPALQRTDLKVGDKFTVNGKVYSYQGFSDKDVIVEVN